MTQEMEDRRDDGEHPFRIGPYTVLRVIGRGAMGVVYSAYDERLDRKIAVKHLRATYEVGSGGQPRLLREAQALARVSHPNVVQVYEVGEHEREVYLAMEFVRGRTLRDWLRGPVRPWRELLMVYLQAGRGLAAAHGAGLVHRDFKPDNVMLGDDGRVRVMDFGLARALDEPAATLQGEALRSSQELSLSRTAAGRLIGTPAYMAPEQHAGGFADARSDQFAFCVALYEALYGQRPFAGDDLRSLTASVTQGRVREASRRPVPRWLRRIVVRGLAVDPARRWPSMDAMLGEIDRGQAQSRRRVAAGALLACTVVGAGAWGWQANARSRTAEACAAAGAEIEGAWNDEARTRVRAAFVATHLGYAATTADKLMPWLDRQAEDWAAARTAVCMDAERRALADDLLDRSLWCLDERRMALESLVDELARPDATMVPRAVTAAAALEPVDRCRDAATVAQLPTPPSEGREALRSVQAQLLRAGNLQAAGRYDDGLALAQDALARAERLAWPPLVAQARQRVGSLLWKQGKQPAEAEAAVEAAYFEAAEAGVAGVVADAAIELVLIVGDALARPAEGLRWGRLAEVAVRSLGPEPGVRAVNRLTNVATVHKLAGEYEQALALHEQALAIREQILPPGHPDFAISYNNLANTRFLMGAYPEARALHERALALREQAFGPEHPDVASSLNNLGAIHVRAGEHEEALVMLRKALAIRERALGPAHPEVAVTLLNTGSALQGMGDFAEVRPLFERALAIQERSLGPDHPTVAATVSNLGIVLNTLDKPDEARVMHERALAIQERVFGPEHPNVAITLMDLAVLNGTPPAEARRLHARALTILEAALGGEHPDVATSLQFLADLDLAEGALVSARERATRALAIREAALGPDHGELAPSLVTLAAVAMATGRPAEAVPLASRAVALYEAQTAPPEPLADAAFVLAQALWEAPAGAGRDRVRALELALRARDDHRAATGHERQLAEVEAWLLAHPAAP